MAGYTMAHAGHIYVIAPYGRFVDVWLEGDVHAETFAADLLNLIRTARNPS